MAPEHQKSLFFRGKAYIQVKEYDQGIDTLERLVKINPEDISFKQELVQAKKTKAQEN